MCSNFWSVVFSVLQNFLQISISPTPRWEPTPNNSVQLSIQLPDTECPLPTNQLPDHVNYNCQLTPQPHLANSLASPWYKSIGLQGWGIPSNWNEHGSCDVWSKIFASGSIDCCCITPFVKAFSKRNTDYLLDMHTGKPCDPDYDHLLWKGVLETLFNQVIHSI